MKRLIKILLTTIIVLFIGFWATKTYLKYSVKKTVSEKTFTDLVDNIKSAPTLPQNFKDLYAKVYPDIFNDNFTFNALGIIFGQTKEQCPSRQVANECWSLFADNKSIFGRKLDYIGFTWLLEDHVSQEKCFEYLLSRWDFLYNTKGPNEAAIFYYKKPLDSLTIDEQIGMILKIQNPSAYDNIRRPEQYIKAVKQLKEKITGHNSK